MTRIALVEDDPMYRAQMKEYLERYSKESGEKLAVRVFGDGDEIALNYRPEYDIILMDIQMKYMDGMTAAAEIRKVDDEVVIIFITNMTQYAIKGYAVDALDFVVKPISYFAFFQCIDRAIGRMRRRARRFLYVAGKNGGQKLEHSRILFVEVDGHHLIYHMTDGSAVDAVGTMKEVEESLDSEAFFRCNKCYLVNLEHVDGIQDGCAVVRGDKLLMSRGRRGPFLEALADCVGGVGP